MPFGFDDPAQLHLYWVNQFLDVSEEPEGDVVAQVLRLRPIEWLVEALHSEDDVVRSRATQMLWQLWMAEKGELAYDELLYGVDLMEDERWDDAMACFSGLIEHLPDFAEAYNKRATVHYLLGRYAASVRDALVVIRLNPYHFGAWHGLGLCYIRLRQYDKAIAALRRARSIQPYAEANARLLAYCQAQLAQHTGTPRE
jgi:tetratricopeptide (TPR) repeat protein